MSLFTCGLLWCFYSYSDGTHSLQMIHWWASDVMLNFSKSVPIKKWTHLQLGWPESDYIFNYFLSIPLIIKGALSKFLSEFSWILLIPKVPLTLILFWWVTCRYPEPYYSYRLSTGAGAGAGARPRMALGQEWHSFRTGSHFHFQTAVRGSLVRDQHGFGAGSEPRSAIQDNFSSPSGKVVNVD